MSSLSIGLALVAGLGLTAAQPPIAKRDASSYQQNAVCAALVFFSFQFSPVVRLD
jgi:hypothetical protein